MKKLIKQNWHIPLFGLAAIILLATNSFGLNMQSHLVLGALTLIPASLIFTGSFNTELKFGKAEILLTLFLFFFFLSLVFSKHPYGFHEFITFTVGVIAYLIAVNLHHKTINNYSVWVTVLIGSAFSIFGIYELMYTPLSRLDGLFTGYPNAMASLLLIVLPLNWLLIQSYKFQGQRYPKIVAITLAILNASAIWLTFSRGGLTALAVTIGAGAGLSLVKERAIKKIIKNLITIFAGLAVAFALAFAANQQNEYPLDISDRATNEDVSSQRSVSERLDFYHGSLKIAHENPLLGVGPGGFEYFYPKFQPELLALSDHPHNLILKLLSESGYPAAIIFTIFLALVIIKGIWEFIWIRRKDSPMYSTLFVIFLGLLAHNMVDYNLNFTILSVGFFTIAGLIENPFMWHEDESAPANDLLTNKKYTTFLSLLIVLTLAITALQGFGYSKIKAAEAKVAQKPLEAQELLTHAKFTPFKHQYYELDWRIKVQATGEPIVVPERYKNFHPAQFYTVLQNLNAGQPNLDDLNRLIELNPKNTFSYYLIRLFSLQALENYDQIAVEAESMKPMLAEYTILMRQNAHDTVTTLNPYVANRIYNFFIAYFLQVEESTEKVEEWTLLQAEYLEAWKAEIDKYNERFGTEFNQEAPDETVNSYF